MPAKKNFLDQAATAYRQGRAAIVAAEKEAACVDQIRRAEAARLHAIRIGLLAHRGRNEDPKRAQQALMARDALISAFHRITERCVRSGSLKRRR